MFKTPDGHFLRMLALHVITPLNLRDVNEEIGASSTKHILV